MTNKIYCSTTGAGKLSAFEIADLLIQSGIRNIELSGGIFTDNARKQILELNSRLDSLLIHNYFPVPRESFVINLSSYNKEILDKSIEFLKNSIDIASELNSKKYAIHSGFLIDPQPKDLGGLFNNIDIQDRDKSLEIFKNSILELENYASVKGVELLIENNVMNLVNFNFHNQNIFLLTHPEEILTFFKQLPNSIGLLLDIGHLKVSSNVLKFNFLNALESLGEIVTGYHLSENSGFSDDHKSFSLGDCAYKSLIKKRLSYYCLEFKEYDFNFIKKEVHKFSEYLC
jgi:hypothetical protein